MERNCVRIGLLLHNLDAAYPKEIISHLTSYGAQYNIELFVFPFREIEWPFERFAFQFWKMHPLISSHTIDVLIIATGTQCRYIGIERFLQYLQQFKHLPIVSLGIELPDICSIITDSSAGFADLVAHIITKHKCKNIAVLSALDESPETREREVVIKTEFQKHAISYNENLIFYGNYSYSSGYQAFQNYTTAEQLNFDAVIAFNDDMAQGCISWFTEHGIRVPQDVIVTGYDDILQSANAIPSISTVTQQMDKQIKLTLDYALASYYGEKVPLLTKIPTLKKIRQSCGCCSRPDPESRRSIISESFMLKYQINILRNFENSTRAGITLTQLQNNLKKDLIQFDIQECTMCFYPKPQYLAADMKFILPEEVKLFLGYSAQRDLEFKNQTVFNPHYKLFPEPFFENERKPIVILPLFHEFLQFGYMVFTHGSFDSIVYEMLDASLSRMIAAAYAFTCKEEERKRLQKKNENLKKKNSVLNTISLTDELTGILNRRGFSEYSQNAMQQRSKESQKGVVLYGDMDNLKKINDTFGHDAGDDAIKAIAHILQKSFRDTDIVARMGGDEFAVVAFDITKETIGSIESRIKRLCTEWNEESGRKFSISITIGAAEFTNDDTTLDHLLTMADNALYESKKLKKRGII